MFNESRCQLSKDGHKRDDTGSYEHIDAAIACRALDIGSSPARSRRAEPLSIFCQKRPVQTATLIAQLLGSIPDAPLA